jgi:hypothetical protein
LPPSNAACAWKNIKENIKTSAKVSLDLHEMKQHKPRSDEEYLGILDKRKQAKMQWIQDPSQSNVDNLNNVKRYNNTTKTLGPTIKIKM